MTREKSTDVRNRLGIYKHIEDVPYRSRLEQFETRYEQVDVWGSFVASHDSTFDSDHYQATFRKAGAAFKSHMRTRGRHHALACPSDIESWLGGLAETRTPGTVYSEYWVRVEEFYTWLLRHTAHPHVYNPVWMAAATYPTAGAMWTQKTKPDSSQNGEN